MIPNKKKYFFFPKLQLKHLLFLLFFIISILKKTFQMHFEKSFKLAVDFLKLYLYDIGDFFSIIPFLITKKRTQTKKLEKKTKRGKNDIKYLHTDVVKDSTSFKNALLFSIVDFIAQISPVVFYIVKEDQKLEVRTTNLNTIVIFNIVFIMLFSYLILHTKFYNHHIFALLIDIFCFIILTVFDFIKIYKEKEGISTMAIIYLLIKTINVILYSFSNVLAKFLILYNFFSTYGLLVVKSIFDLIFLIIFSSPFIFKKIEIKNEGSKLIFSMIADIFEEKKYYIIVICYTLISFLYNNLSLKIIDVFSPNHFAISRVLENMGVFIIDLIINGIYSEDYIAIKITVYILLIFSTIIFNEFLVINIFNFAKNTKLFLDYEFEIENCINEEFEENEEPNSTIYNDDRKLSLINL